jgi:hypothetical protein
MLPEAIRTRFERMCYVLAIDEVIWTMLPRSEPVRQDKVIQRLNGAVRKCHVVTAADHRIGPHTSR